MSRFVKTRTTKYRIHYMARKIVIYVRDVRLKTKVLTSRNPMSSTIVQRSVRGDKQIESSFRNVTDFISLH
jgi:predicted NAD-dependent protein-ADP-ribosyltransferase YbiA (DUF1768 family)